MVLVVDGRRRKLINNQRLRKPINHQKHVVAEDSLDSNIAVMTWYPMQSNAIQCKTNYTSNGTSVQLSNEFVSIRVNRGFC